MILRHLVIKYNNAINDSLIVLFTRDGNRTQDLCLASIYFTTKLHMFSDLLELNQRPVDICFYYYSQPLYQLS